MINKGFFILATEHYDTLLDTNSNLRKINSLSLKKEIYKQRNNLIDYGAELLKIENELLIATEEFLSNIKIKSLYNQHVDYDKQQNVSPKIKRDFASKIEEEIVHLENPNFSDDFYFNKYIFLLNISIYKDDFNGRQKYSFLLLQYWKISNAVSLPLLQSVIGVMKAIRFLEKFEDVKSHIIEIDSLILIHPTASPDERNLSNLIKFANIIEICIQHNIPFEKVANEITFENLFIYILDFKFTDYNLQSFSIDI